MPRPPDALPGWLLAELDPTLLLAAALSPSSSHAAGLVAEALARDPSLAQLPSGHDPVPLLRAALLRTHLRGDGDPLRAAVVLRDDEHLTTSEIATLLDRPARRVAHDLAGVPAGALDLRATKRRADAPTKTQVIDGYAEAVRRRRRDTGHRRRLIGAGLLAGALVVTAAVVLPSLTVRLVPPDVREPGEWRFTHRVELADGWALEQRRLTHDTEQTVIRLPTTNGDPGTCTVLLADLAEPLSPLAETHPVTVRGRDASYVDDPELDPYLIWSYADGRYAAVSCSRLVTPESLQLQVADAVVFAGDRPRLPFTLTARPAGHRLQSISWSPGPTEEVVLELAADDAFGAPGVWVGYGREQPADRCLGPADVQWTASTVGPRPDEVCLTASWSTEDPAAVGVATAKALDEVAGLVRIADDPADPRSWFDAADLPG